MFPELVKNRENFFLSWYIIHAFASMQDVDNVGPYFIQIFIKTVKQLIFTLIVCDRISYTCLFKNTSTCLNKNECKSSNSGLYSAFF